MIARLTGVVAEKGIDHVVLDVHGVGYRVAGTVSTLAALPPVGESATLNIHTHVREDTLDLYGFSNALEETVFHALISTPNIGCKKAINILSGLPAEEVIAAVRAEDPVRLAKARGVGKKTAERLVVELKDRVPLTAVEAGGGLAANGHSPVLDDLVGGLTNLGYKADVARQTAEVVLAELGDAELPALLREALGRLRR